MLTVRMAWRNLWRQKRRTAITMVTVAFGLWLAVTFLAIAEHSYLTTIDTGARMGTGHVVVESPEYQIAPGLDKKISGVGELARIARKHDNVTSANPRISGQAIFAAGARNRGGAFVAVDPRLESAETMTYLDAIVKGEIFAEPDARGAVIGSTMAEKLRVDIGKKMVFTTTDENGEMVSDVVRISAIFETTVEEVDGGFVILPIDRVREAVAYQPEDATQLAILLEDQKQADEVAGVLKDELQNPDVAVLPWNESMADLASFIAIDRAGNQIFQIFIAILVAAGVLNTILMSVLERGREFGVLLAVGMRPTQLFFMVLAESVFIGLLGLILGAIINVPWCIYLAVEGINFAALMGEGYSIGGVLVDPVMKFALSPQILVAIVVVVFFLCVIAGLYPAWRAGRTEPIESLRTI